MFKSILAFFQRRRDRKLRERCVQYVSDNRGQYVPNFVNDSNEIYVFIKYGAVGFNETFGVKIGVPKNQKAPAYEKN